MRTEYLYISLLSIVFGAIVVFLYFFNRDKAVAAEQAYKKVILKRKLKSIESNIQKVDTKIAGKEKSIEDINQKVKDVRQRIESNEEEIDDADYVFVSDMFRKLGY